MPRDDLEPHFAGTFHVTDDLRYAPDARFAAVGPTLVDGWVVCSDCGRGLLPGDVHPDSDAQRGEPICRPCVKKGAFAP